MRYKGKRVLKIRFSKRGGRRVVRYVGVVGRGTQFTIAEVVSDLPTYVEAVNASRVKGDLVDSDAHAIGL